MTSLLLACSFSTPSDSAPKESADSEPGAAWYLTCGDPACSGYSGPTDGVDLCDDEVAGADCTAEGATCDPVDDCNALLICATEDPRQQEGGCPISRATHKRDVRYLDDADRARLAREVMAMPLATWSYRWEPPGTPAHLGFVIDDNEGSHAVAADGNHVDLYGYTSLALLAVQEQAARLAEQEERLRRQEAEISQLRGELARLRRE